MTKGVALVIVSHSALLAQGVVDVATQMAPNVLLLPAGGMDDGGIGTSYTKVHDAVEEARANGQEVLLLSDLGSAAMLADAVAEEYESGVQALDVPLIEGAVAAAVAAENGEDLAGVVAAAQPAPPAVAEEVQERVEQRRVMLGNTLGLHARPAAMVARIVAEYDAEVTVNGVNGASVLALMGLALPGGAEVELGASGPQAVEVMQALVPHFEEGFGEE